MTIMQLRSLIEERLKMFGVRIGYSQLEWKIEVQEPLAWSLEVETTEAPVYRWFVDFDIRLGKLEQYVAVTKIDDTIREMMRRSYG